MSRKYYIHAFSSLNLFLGCNADLIMPLEDNIRANSVGITEKFFIIIFRKILSNSSNQFAYWNRLVKKI